MLEYSKVMRVSQEKMCTVHSFKKKGKNWFKRIVGSEKMLGPKKFESKLCDGGKKSQFIDLVLYF